MHQIIRQYWMSCTLLSAITICLFAPLTMLTPEDIDLYNKDTIPLNPEQYQAKKAEIVGKLNTLEKQFAKQNFSDAKLLPVIFLTPLDVYPGVCGNWSPLIEYGLSLEHYPKIEKWLKNSTLTQQLIADGFKSSDITIRRQSAFVLSELGTNLAAKVLSQTGLRSRDRTIRFFSCQGLAKAYGVRSICGGGFEWTSQEKVEYFKKMSEFVDGSPALSKACKLPDPRPKSKNPTRVFWIGYPLPNLPDSTKEAELIVCGSLKSIPKSKSKSHDRLARIVAERILKNSKNQDLKSIVVSTYSGWSHNKGIFFLKRQPDGKYDCLNGPYLETLPYVSSSGIPNNPNPKDLELILLKQMVDIASCPESSLNVGRQIASDPSYDRAMAAFIKREIAKYGKDSEFTKVIYSSNDCSDADDARARAYSTLIALPKTIPLLRAKLDSNELDETAKIWIVNSLISLGDYKAISAIQDLLLSDKPLSSSSDWAMLSLCQTLSGNNDSGNRIEVEDLNEETKQLSALMSSKRVRVRRACAQNLRHLYPAQEPLEKAQLALMHIALSDPDEEVRFQAISALEQMWSAELDRQCTEEEFNCNQEKYIERIKRLAFMHNLDPAKAK